MDHRWRRIVRDVVDRLAPSKSAAVTKTLRLGEKIAVKSSCPPGSDAITQWPHYAPAVRAPWPVHSRCGSSSLRALPRDPRRSADLCAATGRRFRWSTTRTDCSAYHASWRIRFARARCHGYFAPNHTPRGTPLSRVFGAQLSRRSAHAAVGCSTRRSSFSAWSVRFGAATGDFAHALCCFSTPVHGRPAHVRFSSAVVAATTG